MTEAELRACRHQLEVSLQEVKDLEGRTENFEEVIRMADARVADVDANVTDAAAQASEALQRAWDVKERAAAVEGAAAEAVEHFRGSTAFAEEVAEGSTEAYLLGFRDGKGKAARVSNISSLNDLEPDVGEESEEPSGGGSTTADT